MNKIFHPRWGRLLLSLFLAAEPLAPTLLAAAVPPDTAVLDARLKNVSFEDGRLLLQLDKPASYRVFSLEKPPRLVVEIAHAVYGKQTALTPDGSGVKKIRAAQFQTTPDKTVRVVMETEKPLAFRSSQEGDNITVNIGENAAFKTEKTIAAQKPSVPDVDVTPGHKTALPRALKNEPPEASSSLSGDAEASLSSAAAGLGKRSRNKGSKDIMANLPKNPVTIDFDDADVKEVFRVLAEMSGINIIHSTEIRGTVTIHLDQVPFDEAFNTILTMQGLTAQQMGGNILRILTPEALSTDRGRAVMTYKTVTLNYAKAAEVAAHLGAVRIHPNAKVTVDERTNSLVITDTPEGLAAAERLITELDKKPQQVMIEAKIVEIQLSDSLDLGIQWEYLNNHPTSNGTRAIGTLKTDQTNEFFQEVKPDPITGAPALVNLRPGGPGERGTGVSLPGPQTAAISFGFINNTDILTAQLGALATKGLTKILSEPKVITINNQQASIQVGSKIPFSVTTVAATGVATQSFQFVDTGIILTVTPTVNADDRVRLVVRPEVTFPGANGPAGPTLNTRNAQTEVIIRDGQTLVIGGLIDDQTRDSASKVPILGDIPVLGIFFRSTSTQKNRNDLLVFVTPRIVRE